MPLVILIIALFFPRLAALLLWLAGFLSSIDLIWIILGIIFAPMTLLWVGAVQHWSGGAWGILQIIVLLLAIMYDFGGSGYGWRYWYPDDMERHIEPEHHI